MNFLLLILPLLTNAALADTQRTIFYVWDMETDPAWTMNGEWEYGNPLGLGGDTFGGPDPTGGATGKNCIGINHAGDYSIELGGPYDLITGSIDCSNIQGTQLQFQRWLNIDWQPYVTTYISVSNDGMTWSEIWSNSQSTEIVDMEWIEYSYDISKIADGQQTVFIKWDYCIKMDGLKLAWAYSGWNIDDVVISGVAPCAADIDGNGDVGVGDVLSIIEQWGLTNSPADLNNDGIVNVSDLLVVVGNWGPCN